MPASPLMICITSQLRQFLRIVGLMCSMALGLAHSPVAALSACEENFAKVPVQQTISMCREELTTQMGEEGRIAVLETLGKAYQAVGEFDSAISTWREASSYLTLSRSKQNDNEKWARLQVLVALAQQAQGNDALAESQLRKAEETLEPIAGRYNPAMGVLQDALGTFYALSKKPVEAEKAFTKARAIFEVRLGRTHLRTIEARMNHAVGLLDLEKEEEAKTHFSVLAELINSITAYADEPLRAEILTFLGTLQMRQDSLVEAAKNYQLAYEVRDRLYGANDVRTSQSLNNLGVVLYRAGDLARAELALSRAYIVRKDILGDKDPLTISTQKNLQAVIAAQKEQR